MSKEKHAHEIELMYKQREIEQLTVKVFELSQEVLKVQEQYESDSMLDKAEIVSLQSQNEELSRQISDLHAVIRYNFTMMQEDREFNDSLASGTRVITELMEDLANGKIITH